MSEIFKLIKEEFSDKFQERQWTYECLLEFIFNKKIISYITITNYYQTKPGREMITNELILELLEKMNGQILKPTGYKGKKKPYKWETSYQGRRYRIIFWYEDGTTNHLWIRNCHRID